MTGFDHPPLTLRVVTPMRNQTAAALRKWAERRAEILAARQAEKEAKE